MSFSQLFRSPASLERLARGLVYALVFATPLFFLPLTVDVLELNKQTVLVLLTLTATLAWFASMHVSRTVAFRRGWLNVVPVVAVGVFALAAVFSAAPYLSFIGSMGQQYASVLSVLCYAAVFYLAANLFDQPARQTGVYLALFSAALVAGAAGVLSLFGVNVPLLGTAAYNTVGTPNALGVFLAVMTVAANAWWVVARGTSPLGKGRAGAVIRVLAVLVSLTSLFYLIALDYWVLWTVLLAGLLALFGFVLARPSDVPDVGRLTLPFLLTAFALLFLFWFPSPFHLRVPMEIAPNHRASWQIAVETAKQAPLLGSGPGTFAFDYVRLRPLEMNQTAFWNVRFDRPASFFLLLPGTVGVLGTVAWLAFVVAVLVAAAGRVLRGRTEESSQVLVAGTAWIALLAASFLYSFNITLLLLFFLLAGLIASQTLGAPVPKKFGQSPRLGLMLSFGFILVSVAAVTVMFVSGQRYAADLAFARAIRADRQRAPLTDVIRQLDRAATFNRFDDVYYRNLAQALLLKTAEDIAAIQDLPSLRPEDAQRIRALTAASVNAAVRATELSPRNAQNWAVRGALYRELVSLVPGAGDFAVASLSEAVRLEPNNPAAVTELGRAHLAIAEWERQLAETPDEAAAAEARQRADEQYASAIRQFERATELKADYSPAHYQLAIVYERQGELDEAIGKMESVARYNQTDVGVAFQLGMLYLRRAGDDDAVRAQAAFEYAVQLAPAFSNARWFLATIYEQQDKVDQAVEQIQKVAELNPGNELVQTRLERLRQGTTSPAIPPTVEEGDRAATEVPEGQPVL